MLLLVSTNAVAVLPALWSLRNRAHAEWCVYTSSGVSSALYHSCDTGSWCAAQYGTLQFTDFFLSFMAIVCTCVYVAAPPPKAKLTALLSFTIFAAIIAKDNATRSVGEMAARQQPTRSLLLTCVWDCVCVYGVSGRNVLLVIAMGVTGLAVGWSIEFLRLQPHGVQFWRGWGREAMRWAYDYS